MADYGSDDSNEAAVSDGSGSEADLGTDKPMEKTKYLGPEWTGQKAQHADWQWEVDPYMEDAGFKAVMSEKGRKLMESEDATVRAAYRVKNQKYFKHQLRLISNKTTGGKTLRAMIKDDFNYDRDGYALRLYLQAYANDH